MKRTRKDGEWFVKDKGGRLINEEARLRWEQIAERAEIKEEAKGNIYLPKNGFITSALMDWIGSVRGWDIAGTLTFRGSPNKRDYRHGQDALSTKKSAAEKAVRHFWNLVDKNAFGKKSDRFGVRIYRIGFWEKEDDQIHYHFIAKSPDHKKNKSAYRRMMTWIWENKIDGAGHYGVIKPIHHSGGWSKYFTKETRNRSAEGADLATTHLPLPRTNKPT